MWAGPARYLRSPLSRSLYVNMMGSDRQPAPGARENHQVQPRCPPLPSLPSSCPAGRRGRLRDPPPPGSSAGQGRGSGGGDRREERGARCGLRGQRAGQRRQREGTALSCGEKVAVSPPCGTRRRALPGLRARGAPRGRRGEPGGGSSACPGTRSGSGPELLPGEGRPGLWMSAPGSGWAPRAVDVYPAFFSAHPRLSVSPVRALQGSLQVLVTGVGL